MPTPDQATEDLVDLLDSDYPEIEKLVNERRRTGSDKSNLGIPADGSDCFRGPANDYNPSTGPPSASQASRSQSSWERISATSHGTLPTFETSSYSHNTQPEWESLPVEVSGTTDPYMTSNPSLLLDESWALPYAAYSQTLAGSSDPFNLAQDTSYPDHGGLYSDPRWTEDRAVAKVIDPDEVQDDSIVLSGLDYAQTNMSAEIPDGNQHPYRDLEQLSLAVNTGDISQSVMESSNTSGTSDALAQSYPNAPKVSLHHSQRERSQDSAAPRSNKRKRSTPKRDNVDKINLVRNVGACIRCAVLHEECDPGDPCAKCISNAHKAKIWKQPCVKLRLSTAEIHRTGALNFPDGIRKLSWKSNKPITLSLYHVGFAASPGLPSSRPTLQVVCREFRAIDGDTLVKTWISNGRRQELRLPPYAIPASQKKDLNNTLDAFMNTYFYKLLAELRYGQDEIVSITLAEAIRHVKKCTMLQDALSIAIMTRLSTKSFNIAGPQTLGIQQVDDPNSPYYGRIPVPPLLDAQLDHLWMGKMFGTKKSLLPQLKKLIMDTKKRRENWLMIFLTMMVLLSNLELIYQNQCRQGKRYGKTNDRQEMMMDSWKHAAETLNAHFHAVCHGDTPLNMEWDKEAQQAANLDAQSLDFLYALKGLAASRVEELQKRAKDPSQTPLVWILALFMGQNCT